MLIAHPRRGELIEGARVLALVALALAGCAPPDAPALPSSGQLLVELHLSGPSLARARVLAWQPTAVDLQPQLRAGDVRLAFSDASGELLLEGRLGDAPYLVVEAGDTEPGGVVELRERDLLVTLPEPPSGRGTLELWAPTGEQLVRSSVELETPRPDYLAAEEASGSVAPLRASLEEEAECPSPFPDPTTDEEAFAEAMGCARPEHVAGPTIREHPSDAVLFAFVSVGGWGNEEAFETAIAGVLDDSATSNLFAGNDAVSPQSERLSFYAVWDEEENATPGIDCENIRGDGVWSSFMEAHRTRVTQKLNQSLHFDAGGSAAAGRHFVIYMQPGECRGASAGHEIVLGETAFQDAILAHELGHSLATLADEYPYEDVAESGPHCRLSRVNLTRADPIRWQCLMDAGTSFCPDASGNWSDSSQSPLGLYEAGEHGGCTDVHTACPRDLMSATSIHFNEVNLRTIITRIDALLGTSHTEAGGLPGIDDDDDRSTDEGQTCSGGCRPACGWYDPCGQPDGCGGHCRAVEALCACPSAMERCIDGLGLGVCPGDYGCTQSGGGWVIRRCDEAATADAPRNTEWSAADTGASYADEVACLADIGARSFLPSATDPAATDPCGATGKSWVCIGADPAVLPAGYAPGAVLIGDGPDVIECATGATHDCPAGCEVDGCVGEPEGCVDGAIHDWCHR